MVNFFEPNPKVLCHDAANHNNEKAIAKEKVQVDRHSSRRLTWRAGSLLCLALLLGGCATTGNTPGDPLEGFNRGVYAFNKTVDRALLKPATQLYRAVTPDPMESAVSNFFANIRDVIVAANDLLQAKPTAAFEDGARVVFNSTLGLGGLIDIASGFGIERHEEDFGQTLGRWGIDSGPYLVLPLFGPNSVRDTVGLGVDTFVFDPVFYINDVATRNGLIGGRTIDKRARLMKAEKILKQAALDEYSFVRDAYLQRRKHLIENGDTTE